jgi:hypothetical protein
MSHKTSRHSYADKYRMALAIVLNNGFNGIKEFNL